MVTCGIPIANHYSGLKMAFITLTNSCSTVGPITYPKTKSKSKPSFGSDSVSVIRHSFIWQSEMNFLLSPLGAALFVVLQPRLRFLSIGICQMTLAPGYSWLGSSLGLSPMS